MLSFSGHWSAKTGFHKQSDNGQNRRERICMLRYSDEMRVRDKGRERCKEISSDQELPEQNSNTGRRYRSPSPGSYKKPPIYQRIVDFLTS